MSWVRPDLEILHDLPHTPANTQLYDAVIVVVSQKLGRKCWLVGWLCLTSHRQRDHLGTEPPFTVPCEGRVARFLHRPHWESNPGWLLGSPLHYRCATPAPHFFLITGCYYIRTDRPTDESYRKLARMFSLTCIRQKFGVCALGIR